MSEVKDVNKTMNYKKETYGKKDDLQTLSEMNMTILNKLRYLFNTVSWDTYLKFYPEKNIKHFTRYCKKYFKNNSSLVGAEIGVANGINAWSILKNLNINKMYLVDCWEPYFDKNYGAVNEFNEYYAVTYGYAKKRLKEWSNKTVFMKKRSEDAVEFVEDRSLDFCYIDAQHDYDNVLLDCKMWCPKVKLNGVIGGHDFDATHIGVVCAVIEFCKENNFELQGYSNDWWAVKIGENES